MSRRFSDDEPRREAPTQVVRAPSAPWATLPSKHRDPFFDRPYEASTASSGPAEWEKSSASTPVGRAALSANIRSKRKVAALLGGGTKA